MIIVAGFLVIVAGFDLWGYLTLGQYTPDPDTERDNRANAVVMVFGATGSVGDGLLKAAIEDPDVDKVYVVTRRSSKRIDAGVASGKVEMFLHQDFTEYENLQGTLKDVNTVLWGLGTSSLKVDDETFRLIHVDFPVAFVDAWLAQRTDAPMSFHYITGMGTDPEGSQQWARDKGYAEQAVAEMAQGTGLRTYAYRSAYVRPTSEEAGPMAYVGEVLLRPGHLVVTAKELGEAMLEIGARGDELPNGTLIDNADTIRYAEVYPY